jgi:hypothetical protein
MRKRHVVPAVLIAGLGFLGSLAGASPGRAQDWICQELQGSQCYYPSTIFCYWSEEEIGVCDCLEDPVYTTYDCRHTSQTGTTATAGVSSLPDFLKALKSGESGRQMPGK